ncbi:MAG: bifunctional riboflavin kinase/FAD synthetase [Bacillaceae bacterium]|nr:bifunctional riboflavin kinase/FAD synthetase [Bacillaceae bacterium]
MKVYHLQYPISEEEEYAPSVMAIGYFDGVHLGHQRVIQKAIDEAKKKSLKSAVMTFDPHPREVLGKTGYNQYLTPLSVKLNLMKKMGVDMAYVVHFDIPFSSIYPEDFIEEVIIPLQVRHVVVGFDYTFGYRGTGTSHTLASFSRDRYDLDVVQPVNRYGEKVSSTMIREYLHQGEVEQASYFLGRPYTIKGKVIHGEGRGRTIGFPTANLLLEDPYIIPRNGVYGVKVTYEGQIYDGLMNIGIKPTFETRRKEKSLEVYIFDLDENLYEKELEVAFLYFIREEQKFASVEDLIKQINTDVETARERLKQS